MARTGVCSDRWVRVIPQSLASARLRESLYFCSPFSEQSRSTEQAPADSDSLEPEMNVVFVRPADSAVNLGSDARDFMTDFGDVCEGVACHQGCLIGKRVKAMRCVPD